MCERPRRGRRSRHEIVAHLDGHAWAGRRRLLPSELARMAGCVERRESPPPGRERSRGHRPVAASARRRCSSTASATSRIRSASSTWVGRRGRAPGGDMSDARFVMAIDQGTTSSRAILFDHAGELVGTGQREHRAASSRRAGWVEHDAAEIRDNVHRGDRPRRWMRPARRPRTSPPSASPINARPPSSGIAPPASRSPPRSSGRTPARRISSTASRPTAAPGASASRPACRSRRTSRRPRSPGSSTTSTEPAPARRPASSRSAPPTPGCSGTSPAAPDGGVHATDVTNASRTLLMDLRTLDWDDDLLDAFGIPRALLPEIRSSSEVYGEAAAVHSRCPACRSPASSATSRRPRSGRRRSTPASRRTPTARETSSSSTPGTEIMHSRERPHHDRRLPPRRRRPGLRARGLDRRDGLAHPVAARQPRHHRERARTSSSWRSSVDDNGGVYFVPAFSGLFAPYWRPDARGVIVGLTRFANKGHIARAALEATAFQTREVLDAVNADAGLPLAELRVDGGMVANGALMQFQADILGRAGRAARPSSRRRRSAPPTPPGSRSASGRTSTSCAPTGARTPAGCPSWMPADREERMRQWKRAVTRSFDWVEGVPTE